MASKNLIIVHLLTATLTLKVAQGCREDGTIRCTWTRGPPPSVALIHCETDIPGNRLHEDQYTEISGRVNYTRWTVQQRPCLFKIGVNCAHIFIRIDSPTDEQNISVCRIPDALNQRSVCSCLDLRGKLLFYLDPRSPFFRRRKSTMYLK